MPSLAPAGHRQLCGISRPPRPSQPPSVVRTWARPLSLPGHRPLCESASLRRASRSSRPATVRCAIPQPRPRLRRPSQPPSVVRIRQPRPYRRRPGRPPSVVQIPQPPRPPSSRPATVSCANPPSRPRLPPSSRAATISCRDSHPRPCLPPSRAPTVSCDNPQPWSRSRRSGQPPFVLRIPHPRPRPRRHQPSTVSCANPPPRLRRPARP
jgi:hypothetical protein